MLEICGLLNPMVRIGLIIMSMHVFTYGSLMFDRVWSKVIGSIYKKTGGRLYGYKRRKIRGEIYPALLPGTEADHVDGTIYLEVSLSDIKILDEFEGEYYQRDMLKCELADGSRAEAAVYVFKEQYRDLIEDKEWEPLWFAEAAIRTFLTEYEGFG